jgi:hypothetical protein
MKNLISIALLAASLDASAATAYLRSCDSATSVTGRFIYVGTYAYGGQTFQRTFTSYCPSSVEVY